MNSQSPESIIKCREKVLSSRDAWELWNKLNRLTDALWDVFEGDFQDFCIKECDSIKPQEPYPF